MSHSDTGKTGGTGPTERHDAFLNLLGGLDASGLAAEAANPQSNIVASSATSSPSARPTAQDWSAMETTAICTEMKRVFPDNDFGPSPHGGAVVRINGKVDFHPAALQRLSTTDRDALLKAVRTPDDPESKATLRKLATSGSLRLRYPEHAVAGVNFVTGKLGDKDDAKRKVATLAGTATEAEKMRLYDLSNRNPPPKQDKGRDGRGMDFALRMDPASLPELVNNFEFYDAYCEDLALTEARAEFDAEQKQVSEGNLEKSQARSLDAIKRVKRADIGKRHSDAKGDITAQAVQDVTAALQDYKNAVTTTGIGTGAIDCAQDPEDSDANRGAIQALAKSLKFGDVSTAAYHTLKHYKEIDKAQRQADPTRTKAENMVLSYHTAARGDVSRATGAELSIGQTGGEKHIFKPGKMRAIVWLNGGKTGFATYTA